MFNQFEIHFIAFFSTPVPNISRKFQDVRHKLKQKPQSNGNELPELGKRKAKEKKNLFMKTLGNSKTHVSINFVAEK